MPNPNPNEPEWIELYNYSENTIKLSNYTISDSKKTTTIPNFNFYSNQYVILSSDTLALKIQRNIPGNARLFQIQLPTLNNDLDIIKISQNNMTLDSINYNLSSQKKGISLERVNPQLPSSFKNNLLQSIHQTGATPGLINSNYKNAYDIELTSINKIDNNLFFKIKNNGLKHIEEYNFTCFVDINQDNQIQTNETIIDIYEKNIPPYDSINLIYSFDMVTDLLEIFGSFNLIAFLNTNGDDNFSNDTSYFNIYIAPPKKSILINEIMFETDSKNAEYIELYNTSDFDINLKDWQIKDKSSLDNNGAIIDNIFILNKKSYALIAYDSLLFNNFGELLNEKYVFISKNKITLNNSGDELYLIDASNTICDNLSFDYSWHNPAIISTKNVSLEKINPLSPSNKEENWTSSADNKGGTPARENSVFRNINKFYTLNAKPNPFSPFNKGTNSKCQIEYNLPFHTALINSKMFTTQGIEIKNITSAKYSASTGKLFWDGTNNNGEFMQPGPYVFYLEAINSENDEVFVKKIVIIIGSQ